MTTATQITKAIRSGLAFKRNEVSAQGSVTEILVSSYQIFNQDINGLDAEQKEYVNSEIRRLIKKTISLTGKYKNAL